MLLNIKKSMVASFIALALAGCNVGLEEESTETGRDPNAPSAFLFSEQSVKSNVPDKKGGVYKDGKVLTVSDNQYLVFYGALADRALRVMPFSYDDQTNRFVVSTSNEITIRIAKDAEDDDSTVYWAPSMHLEQGETESTLYLYYAKGKHTDISDPATINWPSFRGYVSSLTFANGSNIAEQIKTGTFTVGKMITVNENFAGNTDFGIIDLNVYHEPELDCNIPRFQCDIGGDYLSYYTLVLNGKPNVRPHDQHIRMKKMDRADRPWEYENSNPDAWMWEESGLYFAEANPEGDDGVTEASRVYKLADEQYLLTMSHRPSDKNQYIRGYIDGNPSFNNTVTQIPFDGGNTPGKWDTVDGFDLLSAEDVNESWASSGVGHSDLFIVNDDELGKRYYLFYQGLDQDGFSFGATDITEKIKSHL